MVGISRKWHCILFAVLVGLHFFCATTSWGQNVYTDPNRSSPKPIELSKYKYSKESYFDTPSDPVSQLMIGVNYMNGWAVQPDITAACNWYAKAASREIPLAQHYFAICISKKIILNDLIPKKIFEKSMEGGHLLSSCFLAEILLVEDENKESLTEYISQCEYLAKLGSPIASFHMYKILSKEGGGKVLTEKALNFLVGAAQDEIPEAKFILGRFLISISKDKYDFSLGLKFLEDAASLGFTPAFDVIAESYISFLNERKYEYSKRYLLEKSYLWSSSALTRSRELELKYRPHVEHFRKLIPSEVVDGLDKLRENYLSSVGTSLAPLFH